MTPAAFILTASAARDFKGAVILGQGLPNEINGQPVQYFWKESLPLGSYRDAAGKAFSVDSARVENLIGNFKKAKANGFLPFLPPDHKTRRGDKNFGFVVDAKVNDKGGLDLLHQVIGEDSIAAIARNKSSICTVSDVTDEHGNVYSELIDHNAILPDPQLNGLDAFTPAIAASRGSVPVTSLQLAAQKENPMLDLKKLRAIVSSPNAAKELSDEEVIVSAETKLADAATAATKAADDLKLSRAQVTELEGKISAADNKVLELSRRPEPTPPPDSRTMLLLSRTLKTERQAALDTGGISPDTAKEIDKLLEKDGKPNVLALSAVGAGDEDLLAFRLWSILKANKPVAPGERTRVQTLSRQTPPDDGDGAADEKAMAEKGLAQGKAYRESQKVA